MAVPMSFGGGRTFDTCKVIEKYERWITEAESAQDEAETQRREALESCSLMTPTQAQRWAAFPPQLRDMGLFREDAGWAEGQSMKEGPGRRKPNGTW